ncbi:cob(I)yrinic acid a,c-diamide adenosyltransferase [Patescibacteria group bacterium]|nr:cob(I)yrinic acid a,c-diamide adenosyltransferase [Patescibacteria group bacterium]
MLIVITGDGKGKTTSALGQAKRSCGDGRKVLMLQFIKGPWKSGEDNKKVWPPGFELRKGGLGFVGILGDKLPREKHIEAAQKTLEEAFQELESGNWDMIILDEIHNALDLGLVKKERVVQYIERAQEKKVDLIFTGRNAPRELIKKADIVSEIRDIKHVFEKGVKARKGLDY